MNRKVEVINYIIQEMRIHIDAQTCDILHGILIKAMHNIEIQQMQTELATSTEINDKIIGMFKIKKAGKLAAGTVEQYLRHIAQLLQIINKPLTSMQESDIEYFLLQYKNRGNSKCTVNNCRRYLSAFFSWMRKSKLMTENPAENIDNYKQTAKPVEHLEPEQWEQLKAGCKKTRDRSLLEFLRCTAARDGEVSEIKISDVDWSVGKISIYGQKSDKYRIVCIDRLAKEYLQKYLKERKLETDSSEPLFVTIKGDRPLTKSGIYSSIKSIAKRAVMKINVYPHLIRKTTATNIIRRGGSSEEVSEYLGHAEKNTASRYYIYKGEEHILEIFRKRIVAI